MEQKTFMLLGIRLCTSSKDGKRSLWEIKMNMISKISEKTLSKNIKFQLLKLPILIHKTGLKRICKFSTVFYIKTSISSKVKLFLNTM
jgi:hypothetical protein